MTGSASKQALRAQLIAARRARSAAALEADRSAIRAHVLQRCAAARWRCVAAYEPLGTEPGSVQLLAGLRSSGVRVLVPLTLADRDLDWTLWSPQRAAAPLATSAGDLGVAELATADAVLVPALAVATDGTRLGRGGGSYDRALPRVRAGVPIVALLFEDELRTALPAEQWDVPVDAVVTPAGWHDLPRNTRPADPG